MTYLTNRNQQETLQGIIYRWKSGTLDIYSTPKLISDEAMDHAAYEIANHSHHCGGFLTVFWHARHVLEAWRKDAV